jgi:hypothetical protein
MTPAETFLAALDNAGPKAARRKYAAHASKWLLDAGDVTWAFGLADTPERRATAIVLQMSGALATGTVALLEAENYYSAAALVRQFIEVEYLTWLFGAEPGEAAKWLRSSQADLRKLYTPAAMRKRSAGRFRDREYWSHCEHGGHPNPAAHYLLPERVLPDHQPPLGTNEFLWVDFGQHLERLWNGIALLAEVQDLQGVGLLARGIAEARSAAERWRRDDPCAALLPRATLDALAGRGAPAPQRAEEAGAAERLTRRSRARAGRSSGISAPRVPRGRLVPIEDESVPGPQLRGHGPAGMAGPSGRPHP